MRRIFTYVLFPIVIIGLWSCTRNTKVIDKAFSRLLFHSMKSGQAQMDEWADLIKKKEAGQGYFPDNVEEILEKEKINVLLLKSNTKKR